MMAKEAAKSIRKQLKEMGYTSRQVSVKSIRCGSSDAIDVSIKDFTVSYNVVEEISRLYEVIRHDERTYEELEGCNTYVSVSFNSNVLHEEAKKYMQYAKNIMEEYKNLPETRLASLAKKDDLEILYNPNWCNGCGECIEICKSSLIHCDDGTSYTSFFAVHRYPARNDYAIAEALAIICNQYDIKVLPRGLTIDKASEILESSYLKPIAEAAGINKNEKELSLND